jgi:DNA-binding Xre family transcriptional regulator
MAMRLVSHVARAILKSGRKTIEFARESGIARSTLEKLIGGHFKEIRRDTIERLASRLGTDDITEFFTLQRDDLHFVTPFMSRKAVTFVFGTHDVVHSPANGDGKATARSNAQLRTTIDLWDFRAQSDFLSFLRRHVPDVRDEMLCFSKAAFGGTERQQVLELMKSQNVVIVGSPKVNPVAEEALCALYRSGVRAKGGRVGGPNLRLAEDKKLQESILGVDGFAQTGVADLKKNKVIVNSEFRGGGVESIDAGIVFVAYRPLGTTEDVTTIVVAGISGCGTYGAMKSLIDEPPDTDAMKPGAIVERAVETVYAKPTDSLRDDRQVVRVTRAS